MVTVLKRVAFLSIVALLAASAAAQVDYELLLREGLVALRQGEVEQAREKLERAVSSVPGDVRGWLGLAQARRVSGDGAGAEEAVAKVVASETKEPWVAHSLAMYYLESDEFGRAAEFEAIYARAEPEDPDVFLRTAAWYLAAGNSDRAVEFARSGIERAERPELYEVLGKALSQRGDVEDAAAAMRSAIRLRPYDEGYRYNLGYVFLQAARFDEAVAAFDEARDVFDKSPRLELGRGVARFGQRRFDEAIDAFLNVSRLNSRLEQPHYFLSRALEHAGDRLGEIQGRFDAFSRGRPAHYLGPFVQAKGLVAAVGPRAGAAQLEQPEKLLHRSIELRQDFWESHFELGLVLDRLKRYGEAESALLKAIELSPASPTPYYRLARVYERLGKKELAQQASQKHQELTSELRSELLGPTLETPILE